MKKLFRSNLYFLLVLLGAIIIPYGLRYIYYFLGIRDTRILLSLNHILLFLVPAIIFLIVNKCNVKETLRLNKITLKEIGLIFIIAIVTYPLMSFCAEISSLFVNNDVGEYISSLSSTPYIVMILLFGVMPAITEEVTLRGIVLSGYRSQTIFKAALMNGILFGIFHLDYHQFLYTAVLGFIMAYVVLITNSIFSSMLMHFTINSMSVTIQKLVSGYVTTEVDTASSASDLINMSFDTKLVVIAMAVFFIICFGGLVYKLINVLKSVHVDRIEVVNINEESGTQVIERERIINLPLIGIILVYIGYMYLFG